MNSGTKIGIGVAVGALAIGGAAAYYVFGFGRSGGPTPALPFLGDSAGYYGGRRRRRRGTRRRR
jgi:hypothetical protein